jgi:hypothetical protein
MKKPIFPGLNSIPIPMLAAALVLVLAFPGRLRAADKAYLITGLRPAAGGIELLLRDLGDDGQGKTFQLVVVEKDRLIDLAAGTEISAVRARRGDILFLGKGGGSSKQMIITPGRTVHPKLAAGQAEEARAIDELSLRIAAELRGAGEKEVQAAGGGADPELERVRRSFLFVLEFALGAPFTAAQERLILDPFGPGWWEARSAGERKSFGQYPQVVAWIMRAGQRELEEMRRSLEETTRQWLKESPASDPVVGVIRARLAERGRTIVAGDPPLTEMAAAAFCELVAYSRLLRRDGSAPPDRPRSEDLAAVRGELLRAWPGFSAAERAQVATAPGLWLVLRTLVAHGDAAQRENARGRLLAVTAGEAPSGRPRGGDSVSAMLKHNVLMNIQQQTFNSYMWSRGFNYQPATGKMW